MTHVRFLFSCAVFLASFLLFLVEPMAAKQLLPVFGGSAAVWITCLVFFQTALLFAYLYAHWLNRRPQWKLHFGLLFCAAAAGVLWSVRPATHESGATNSAHPALAIFASLSVSIGLPFLMLGATSPLLQVWLARIETTGIPYRLFALSNLASLLALGAYPTVIEPNLTLRSQRILWSCGFGVFAAISAMLTHKTKSTVQTVAATSYVGEDNSSPTPMLHKVLWVLLPMGAAMQLSAVTSHLTQNIAAIPLLWILPLAVYLVTLILAFQLANVVPRWIVTRLLVVMLAGLGYMLSIFEASWPLKVTVFFFLAELLVASLFCHNEAYNLRPKRSSETTLFYLLFAAGGALGSVLIGIVSPMLFSFNYDLALSFFVTAMLALLVTWPSGWGPRSLWGTASVLLLVLVSFLHTAYHRDTPLANRNFYGSLRVKQTVGYPGAVIRTLSNGTIQHGTQIFSPELARTPTTYYARDSGVGIAMRNCCEGHPRNVGVIGLGAGTIAAYGEKGDRIQFYEINPAVIPVAQNLFTYMRDSGAAITIVEGDARNSLATENPQKFDILVIDAFSGDAIPLHLLTAEALELYKRHLVPGGILPFHISNQHVDLEPEVSLLARNAGMKAMRISTPIDEERGEFAATWMLVTDNPTFFGRPEVFNQSKPGAINPKVRRWTDDYSTLLPVLHW